MIAIRDGRWALSRVRFNGPHRSVAAFEDRLAPSTHAFYVPQGATQAWALVWCDAALTGNADTIPLPNLRPGDTLAQLSLGDRTALRSALETRFGNYEWVNRQGSTIVVPAFSGATLDLTTPWADALRLLFAHMSHGLPADDGPGPETHNTQYLDDFSVDPSTRWTSEIGTYTWDSGNSEFDVTQVDGDPRIFRYSANAPGSLDHESQVTTIGAASANERTINAGVRIADTGDNEGYGSSAFVNDTALIHYRIVAGAYTTISTTTPMTFTMSDWHTFRQAAEGTGATVTLSWWVADHGATKPSDPGWIGVDGSPTGTYGDTDAARLVAARDAQCGICGRGNATDYDTRHSFWKSRAVSDRGGAPSTNVIFCRGRLRW